MTIRIAHLVDDVSAGGVMRGLEHLKTIDAFGPSTQSTVVEVRKGMFGAPKVDADLIVSHLSVNWRNLPMMIALRARYAHLPLVHVEHSYSEAFAIRNVKARKRFNSLLRATYALFNRVVAVSRAQADWLSREGLVRDDALRVISTSVDLEDLLALPMSSGRNATVIGAIGRFDRQKGFDKLIRAFRAAASPEMKLRLVGGGPEEAALRALAADDPRIEFVAFTNDPAAAYAGCDVIAMPSRWEPYGLVALEARAAGRPVLVAAVDGLKDQIDEGCVAVVDGAWEEAIRDLPQGVFTARIASARREASKQNERFKSEWRRMIAELTAPADSSLVATSEEAAQIG